MDIGENVLELSMEGKLSCLKEVLKKLNKVLYVFDKSKTDNNYNYKDYCHGILGYCSTASDLMNGDLINVVVNLSSVIVNDFSKVELKRVIFESKNEVEFLIRKYEDAVKGSNNADKEE